MNKKPNDWDGNKIPASNGQEKYAERQIDPNLDKIITSIRADMLPATEEQPARKSVFRQENLKAAVGIGLAIIIVTFLWYIIAGPGRPILEGNLASLARKDETPTPTITSSPILPTKTSLPPSSTPTLIPTPKPTLTPTKRPSSTPLIGLNSLASPTSRGFTSTSQSSTPTEHSSTPTETSGCRDALTITLTDVGQAVCVQGTIIETVDDPNYFMVVFSFEKGAFYWVSYDLKWLSGELDTCYRVHGTIDRIGNSPVLIFSYQNLPEVCP